MSASLSQPLAEKVVGAGVIAGPFGGVVGPRRPTETVSRTRLDNCFADAIGRVLRVLAPGGYGKSTIVARWVSGESRVVRWLDFERVDNDPLVLVDALERLLSDLTTGSLEELPRSSHHGRQFADAFLPAFGALSCANVIRHSCSFSTMSILSTGWHPRPSLTSSPRTFHPRRR